MDEALITILESFKYPVYRQGSMSNDAAYPETLITFWQNDSADHAHYDNTEYGIAWSYTVCIYSADPDVKFSLLAEVIEALKAAGWIISGRGYDVASDEASHSGKAFECRFLQTKQEV